MNAIVRLKAYHIVGPRGGKEYEASKIVPAQDAQKERAAWERELGPAYIVNIQDGNIRSRC